MNRVLVIAEAGSCHDGSLFRACALVHAAKEAGADAVKFQFWSDHNKLADRRRVPPHYREIYRRYQLPRHWLDVLKVGADMEGIELMATCYLPEDVATVAPYVKRFKVASFEAEDGDFLRAHIPFLCDHKVIVSLGMNASEHGALSVLDRRSTRFLHCVSAYPAPIEAMNLRRLHAHESDEFCNPLLHGLSDHSRNILTGALAVAAGAEIIEAHLRVETTDPQNPDYATAFSPSEFADYVRHIRLAELAMGSGEKTLQPCEVAMAAYRVGEQAV
jgi:N,N'-diacetyllegionaminate synthase